ncbi:MAG: hypothetical protein RSB67_02490 [Clostridia bacterium]
MQEVYYTVCYFLHGNDCAYTVGAHIGGTIENFAKLMNEKAKKLGITDTNFVNPHGLDDENHYTTAKSMGKMAMYAFKNTYINEAIQTKSITINFGSFSKLLTNTNALLRTYPLADGGKTGFTNGANRCLVASASNNGSRYMSVILGANTTNNRFSNAREILDECFKRYTLTDISKYLNFYVKVPITKGKIEDYEKKYSENISIPLLEGEYERIYIKENIVSNLEAPVKAGEYLGDIQVYIDEEVIYKKDIYLEESIEKKGIFDYMKQGLKDIFKKRDRV